MTAFFFFGSSNSPALLGNSLHMDWYILFIYVNALKFVRLFFATVAIMVSIGQIMEVGGANGIDTNMVSHWDAC